MKNMLGFTVEKLYPSDETRWLVQCDDGCDLGDSAIQSTQELAMKRGRFHIGASHFSPSER